MDKNANFFYLFSHLRQNEKQEKFKIHLKTALGVVRGSRDM